MCFRNGNLLLILITWRLKELLRTRLIECGWHDKLRSHCKGESVLIMNCGVGALKSYLQLINAFVLLQVWQKYFFFRGHQAKRTWKCDCGWFSCWNYSTRKRWCLSINYWLPVSNITLKLNVHFNRSIVVPYDDISLMFCASCLMISREKQVKSSSMALYEHPKLIMFSTAWIV